VVAIVLLVCGAVFWYFKLNKKFKDK